MDRIDQIVSIVNNSITSSLSIGNGNIFGICDKIVSDGKTTFFKKLPNGVQKGAFFDDSWPLTIIHYIENNDFQTEFDKGFGSYPLDRDVYDIYAFVFLPNASNILDAKTVYQTINDSFPNILTLPQNISIGARKTILNVNNISFRKHDIWKNDLTGQIDNLSDNSILLKISYNVKIETSGQCVSTDCEAESIDGYNIYGGDAQS